MVTENHPVSRAVSCGIWIDKGTRDEKPNEAGLAHFVEHLVFKRTKKRTAFEISRDMEAVGGELNAYTSRESTSFVSHALKDDVALSLDILSDLVVSPQFAIGDIRKEKQVVIQEIHMADDNLEDTIFDRFLELAMPKSRLGKPILGSVESIGEMKRATIAAFHERHYRPENITVSVAGNIDHNQIVALAHKHLKFKRSASSIEPVAYEATEIRGFRRAIRRPSEQAHVLIGLPSHDFRNPLRFEGFVVNSLLAGGMTSRLYQKVREDRGLVYSIYGQLITHLDSGLNVIYAGTEPKKMPLVVELIYKELRRLKRDGISRSELDLFKKQVRGQILLGADDIESRMNSIAVNDMVFGRYRPVDTVIRDIDKITSDSCHEYLERFMNLEKLGVLVMGAVPEGPTTKWLETIG